MRSRVVLGLLIGIAAACSKAPAPAPKPKPAAAAAKPSLPPPPTPAQLAQAETAKNVAGQATDGFVVVPAGQFVMGSAAQETDDAYNDAPQHSVTLTRPFEMQATEVTVAQYAALMPAQASQKSECADCPVVNVSWFEAVTYCNALSKQRGLPSCVTLAGTEPTFSVLNCSGYRLPTEAEWEYAARAGTTGPRYGELGEVAWYDENAALKPHPVGQKKANAWGLFDMLGNAYEWTWDWQGDYPTAPVSDPLGAASGINRVFRGGGFKHPDVEARAGFRNAYGPSNQVEFIGFRCVRTLAK